MKGQGKEKGVEGWEWGTYRRSVLRQRGSSSMPSLAQHRCMIDIDRVVQCSADSAATLSMVPSRTMAAIRSGGWTSSYAVDDSDKYNAHEPLRCEGPRVPVGYSSNGHGTADLVP
jgi:hypothetical protein